MKKILKIAVLFLLCQSFQCSKSDPDNPLTNPSQKTADLVAKKQQILDYINSFPCSTSGCNTIAFGDKPCGGSREYLVFSNDVNLATLQQMVTDYNEMDKQNNLQNKITMSKL